MLSAQISYGASIDKRRHLREGRAYDPRIQAIGRLARPRLASLPGLVLSVSWVWSSLLRSSGVLAAQFGERLNVIASFAIVAQLASCR